MHFAQLIPGINIVKVVYTFVIADLFHFRLIPMASTRYVTAVSQMDMICDRIINGGEFIL